jgi:hypothetical protein
VWLSVKNLPEEVDLKFRIQHPSLAASKCPYIRGNWTQKRAFGGRLGPSSLLLKHVNRIAVLVIVNEYFSSQKCCGCRMQTLTKKFIHARKVNLGYGIKYCGQGGGHNNRYIAMFVS